MAFVGNRTKHRLTFGKTQFLNTRTVDTVFLKRYCAMKIPFIVLTDQLLYWPHVTFLIG
jgi:hypothetical protein